MQPEPDKASDHLSAKAPPGAFARKDSGVAGLRVNQKGRERI